MLVAISISSWKIFSHLIKSLYKNKKEDDSEGLKVDRNINTISQMRKLARSSPTRSPTRYKALNGPSQIVPSRLKAQRN